MQFTDDYHGDIEYLYQLCGHNMTHANDRGKVVMGVKVYATMMGQQDGECIAKEKILDVIYVAQDGNKLQAQMVF